LGVGSLWMAGYGSEKDLKKHFRVPINYEIYAALTLGYSDQDDIIPSRRYLEAVVSHNSFIDSKSYPISWRPANWSLQEIRDYTGYAIFAKSQSPKFYRSVMAGEFEQIVSMIPSLEGRTLVFSPFAGNFLFRLLELEKLNDTYVISLNENINAFLENKRRNMGINRKIKYSVFLKDFPFTNSYFDNVLCISQLERFPIGCQNTQ